MARIQFGITNPRGTPGEVVSPATLAEKAETWGYDSFWVPDLLNGSDLDPIVILSGAATRTSHIRLGAGVLILPARPPVQLAKTALSLDTISNGRFILGTGLGRYMKDLTDAQVGSGSRVSLTDESLHILRRLVHETDVSHQGKHFNTENLTIFPRPVRENSLPIWTSAYWNGRLVPEGPLKRAGHFGDGFIYRAPPRLYKVAKEKNSDYAVAFGRDPDNIDWSCFMFACFGPSKEEAWKTVKGVLQGFGRDLTDESEGCYAIGTADDCIEAIQRYIDIGLTHIVISAKSLPEQVPEQYEAFAKEVLPRLR